MMAWPASDSIRLIKQIEESMNEERLYSRWIAYAQNVISFDEFKRRLTPTVFKPDSEIMADTEAILNSFGGSPHGNI